MFIVYDTSIHLCAFVTFVTVSNQPELCLKIHFVPCSKHSPSRNITNMNLNYSNYPMYLNFTIFAAYKASYTTIQKQSAFVFSNAVYSSLYTLTLEKVQMRISKWAGMAQSV